MIAFKFLVQAYEIADSIALNIDFDDPIHKMNCTHDGHIDDLQIFHK